jgi:hypothetical protein
LIFFQYFHCFSLYLHLYSIWIFMWYMRWGPFFQINSQLIQPNLLQTPFFFSIHWLI